MITNEASGLTLAQLGRDHCFPLDYSAVDLPSLCRGRIHVKRTWLEN